MFCCKFFCFNRSIPESNESLYIVSKVSLASTDASPTVLAAAPIPKPIPLAVFKPTPAAVRPLVAAPIAAPPVK